MPEGMKYVIIVGDGMADYPIGGLGGKTPLMVARTPHMDWLAKHGEIGLVRPSPRGSLREARLPTCRSLGMIPSGIIRGEDLLKQPVWV